MENKKTIIIAYYIFLICIGVSLISGCEKFVEVNLPIDKNTAEAIYGQTGSAVSVLNGIYHDMHGLTEHGISHSAALLSDELTLYDKSSEYYIGELLYKNQLVSDPRDFWKKLYGKHMYRINSIIEGVSKSNGIPQESKNILIGEAKFLRAWSYFYLTNLYGDVPLVLTTDFKVNSNIPRSPKLEVFDQIIKDLKEAQQMLREEYLELDLFTNSEERVRPNKFAATALLARVYLYKGNYTGAETEASKVIAQTGKYDLEELSKTFLKNNKESIWQLQTFPNDSDGESYLPNTWEGFNYIPFFQMPPKYSYLSEELLNAFEIGDQRKVEWISTVSSSDGDFHIPYKYKAGPEQNFSQVEYPVMLRLAELYLIRAEARVKLGKIIGTQSAVGDINTIRSRAKLGPTTAKTENEILDEIALQRRLELFTEWGDRWFNLKRTGTLDEVMEKATLQKGGDIWKPYQSLMPIPLEEFYLNKALVGHQNPGYRETY